MSIYLYVILFFIYSFIGWILEIITIKLETRKLVNRGFLMGPYCPIYGWGAISMMIILDKYIYHPFILFIMAMIICSVLEYLTSYFMEKIFHARWWDYSDKNFNINGRICLERSVPFGLLGCLLMYVLNPFFINILSSLSLNFLRIISILLILIFVVDNIISYSIISKISISSRRIIKDDTEEITKKVKEYIINHSNFGKRLMKSFPRFKSIRKR